MNANDLIADLELEPSWTGEERTILLRALRLLAAAEANDGTSPETNRLSDKISRRTFAQNIIKAEDVFDALDLSRTFEQRCNGLAARVAELEPDAERLEWLMRNMTGRSLRECVGELADTGDLAEFRAAIDDARNRPIPITYRVED